MSIHTPLDCKQVSPWGNPCVLVAGHKSRHINAVGTEWSREADYSPAPQPPLPQIFLDAAALISGPRRESYGDFAREAENVSKGWSMITGHPIKPRHVPMMMIWMKLMREAYQPGQDNRNDCAGYLALLDQMLREKP